MLSESSIEFRMDHSFAPQFTDNFLSTQSTDRPDWYMVLLNKLKKRYGFDGTTLFFRMIDDQQAKIGSTQIIYGFLRGSQRWTFTYGRSSKRVMELKPPNAKQNALHALETLIKRPPSLPLQSPYPTILSLLSWVLPSTIPFPSVGLLTRSNSSYPALTASNSACPALLVGRNTWSTFPYAPSIVSFKSTGNPAPPPPPPLIPFPTGDSD